MWNRRMQDRKQFDSCRGCQDRLCMSFFLTSDLKSDTLKIIDFFCLLQQEKQIMRGSLKISNIRSNLKLIVILLSHAIMKVTIWQKAALNFICIYK